MVTLVFLWLANWWDGVELWLTQLAFPFQFALVIVVLAPICLGVAWAIDRLVDLVAGRFGTGTTTEPDEPDASPEPVELAAESVVAGRGADSTGS